MFYNYVLKHNPATIFSFVGSVVQVVQSVLSFDGSNTGEYFSFDCFEKSTTTCRNVAH